MALTRVPASLLNNAFPVRWTGTEADRTAESFTSTLTQQDVNYIFLQKEEGKPNVLCVLTAANPVTWEVINSVDMANIQTSLDLKLNKDITKLDKATEVSDTTLLVTNDAEGNPQTLTLNQVKEYVATKADKLFQGYFATSEALQNAITDPADGYYAIVGATDSVWVWDGDSKAWGDTKITGVVDVSRQVIAGTGLEGGGALGDDVTLSVKYGAEAGTATEGNDPRLDKEIKWTGTATDRGAITKESLTANDVGKIFVQTGVTAGKGEMYQLTSIDPVTWLQIGGSPITAKEKVSVESGTVTAGTNTITLSKAFDSANYYIEVYLSGVRQMKDSITIEGTTITLGGNAPMDMAYDVVIYPM